MLNFGKGGGSSGPSMAQMEASQMRIMQEQMAMQQQMQLDAEERAQAQREAEREAERKAMEGKDVFFFMNFFFLFASLKTRSRMLSRKRES